MQEILDSGVTVSKKKIAERMVRVNKDFGINKLGKPKASEYNPKSKDPIPKKEKSDLDEMGKQFL